MVDRYIKTMLLGLVVFMSYQSFAESLRCRNGIENSVAYIYWEKKCGTNETACFQSVKCTKIGDTPYTDYEWRCVNGRTCSNSTGKWIGSYDNIRGICCFTNNCNAYKGACTDSGLVLTAKWVSIVLTTALAYIFV